MPAQRLWTISMIDFLPSLSKTVDPFDGEGVRPTSSQSSPVHVVVLFRQISSAETILVGRGAGPDPLAG
jgi:hypothetical protein